MIQWAGSEWPSVPEAGRMRGYRLFEKLYEGDHARAFETRGAKLPAGMRKIIYISVNVAGAISRICADFLFGEAPSLRIGKPGTKEQKALDDLIEDNDLLTLLYESALSNSFRGDAVFRLRVGAHGANSPERVIIEQLPAYTYVAERSADNVRDVASESIVWSRPDKVRGRVYLRVQTHLAGTILEQAFHFNPSAGKVGSQVRLAEIYGADAPPDEQQTGMDKSLLVHVPNFRHDSIYYGTSDYQDLVPLFDALNNRLSKIDRILDHHAAPKLIGLPGLADSRNQIDVEKIGYIEADSEIYKYLPRYVTWDGKLEAATQQLERLLLFICQVAEINPEAMGIVEKGGRAAAGAQAGVAIRLKYIQTEHKVNRKKRYFDRGIKKLLRLAMQLNAEHLGGPEIDDEPEIVWQDGLPQIYSEAVTDESTRYAAGLTSKISAIQRIDQCTAEQAAEEMQRMDDEKKAEQEALATDVGLDDLSNGGNLNRAAAVGGDGGDAVQQYEPSLVSQDALSFGLKGPTDSQQL